MKLPLNSPSRLPGPSGSQLEKVHGKSEERYNSFEKEFRMLRNLGEGDSVLYDNPSDYGRYVRFTPKKVIHRVVTHPRATEALRGKVDALMGDYLKAIRREDSSLVW